MWFCTGPLPGGLQPWARLQPKLHVDPPVLLHALEDLLPHNSLPESSGSHWPRSLPIPLLSPNSSTPFFLAKDTAGQQCKELQQICHATQVWPRGQQTMAAWPGFTAGRIRGYRGSGGPEQGLHAAGQPEGSLCYQQPSNTSWKLKTGKYKNPCLPVRNCHLPLKFSSK